VVATVTRSASGKMTTPVPLQHFKRTRFLPYLTEHLAVAGESKPPLALAKECAADRQ
jgi:hypothetical protein